MIWENETTRQNEWHLGVVEKVGDESKVAVSYLVKTDKNCCNWVFPEEAECIDTHISQIIAHNIAVKVYTLFSHMMCY